MSITQSLTEQEVKFLNNVMKETGFKDVEDFMNYINYLRRNEEEGNNNRTYADLLENIVRFLINTKNEYDEDRISCCPDPQEIDKSIDRILIILLRGLLITGYAPSDETIDLMKEYLKRHEG